MKTFQMTTDTKFSYNHTPKQQKLSTNTTSSNYHSYLIENIENQRPRYRSHLAETIISPSYAVRESIEPQAMKTVFKDTDKVGIENREASYSQNLQTNKK
jgi:hypothetical protein